MTVMVINQVDIRDIVPQAGLLVHAFTPTHVRIIITSRSVAVTTIGKAAMKEASAQRASALGFTTVRHSKAAIARTIIIKKVVMATLVVAISHAATMEVSVRVATDSHVRVVTVSHVRVAMDSHVRVATAILVVAMETMPTTTTATTMAAMEVSVRAAMAIRMETMAMATNAMAMAIIRSVADTMLSVAETSAPTISADLTIRMPSIA